MKLTAAAVRHPQVTLILVGLLVAVGASAVLTIPRAEDPSFPLATFSVVTVYPGATPLDVEQLVVDPIEKSLAEIDDIKRIRSRAENGVGVTVVEFTAGVDVDAKHDAVIRQIEATRSKLPDGVTRLETKQSSTTNVAVLQLALVAPQTPYRTLEALSDRLTERLETVPGVKDAEVWGLPDQEIRVALDLERLGELHIPPAQVLGAVQRGDARVPGGNVSQGGRTFSVETVGGYRSVDDVRNVVIAGGPAVVRLSDVADVQQAEAEAVHLTRFNGQRAVFVTVTARDQQNLFHVRGAVMTEVEAFARTLPAGVTLQTGFDQSRNVAHRLGGLSRDFVIAILLVLVTLLPLGLRASLIVMVSIPLSLALGLALLQATGYSLNQLSIVGFVIALGLLVDDSIVVTENVTRFRRMGRGRVEAAIAGAEQIGVAVLGCTATLLFAFLPLLFLPGAPGDFIRSMPLAVVFTIGASLLVALTVIPFFASRVLPAGEVHENAAYRIMNRAIERSYRPLLNAALARPYRVLVVTALLFASTLALVPRIGFSLFPKAGTPQFLVRVTGPEGASIEATDEAVRFVERTLARKSGVKAVMSNVGRGNPQIYYNVVPASEAKHLGEVFVALASYDPRKTPAWIDDLRAELARYPGARIEVKEFENGPPIDAPIAIRLLGTDLDALRRDAARVEAVLGSVAGTRDVDNPLRVQRTDVGVIVDRAKAGLLGVPPGEVERSVRMAVAGLPTATVRDDEGNERDVVVTLPRSGRPTLTALAGLYLSSATGGAIPFSQVARVELRASPSFIQHENKQRAIAVTAQVRNGWNTDRVTTAALAALGRVPLSPGVRWVAAGEIESRQESFGGLGTAILVASFGILTILVLEFRTFKSTLIVASIIPLGVMGGLLALWLSGYTLSFTAVVGFIALIGIEVKNSILLVDFTNQLRAGGLDVDTAVERAGETRFFPVLLTSMTAIGGLIPLALEGSSLYSPLALVIIGGLVSSTVLSRLVTPVLYKLLPPAVAPAATDASAGSASPLPVVATA